MLIYSHTRTFLHIEAKKYTIKVDYFKRCSNNFLQKQEETEIDTKIPLLDEESEQHLSFSGEIINQFINFVQGEKIQLNNENVTSLNYLSEKYEVQSLYDHTKKYISDHYSELAVDVIVTYQKELFDTSLYENIISEHLLEYIHKEQIFLIDFSILYRIITKYLKEKVQQKPLSKEMINFLFKCIDNYGRKASVLFSNVQFDASSEILNRLLTDYSTNFDFHFINSIQLKTIYEIQNENLQKTIQLERRQEQAENQFLSELNKMKAHMKEQIENKKLISQLTDKNKKNEEEISDLKNELKILKAQLEGEISNRVSQSKYISICNSLFNNLEGEKQLSVIQTIQTEQNDDFINSLFSILSFLSNKLKADNNNLNYICIRGIFNKYEIIIPSYITEILCEKNFIYSTEFHDVIRNLADICIEIKYPSNKYDIIYDELINIKKLYNQNLKTRQFCNGIDTIYSNPFVHPKIAFNYVKLDNSVTFIKKNAFSKWPLLTHISIPSSVTSIEEGAFAECSSLRQITIPSSISKIKSFTFHGCSSLTQVTIPSSVKSIGNCAFTKCLSLIQITIPSSVTSIEEGAFAECSSLRQITIPSSISKIENYTFCECSSLMQVTIPSSVTKIKSNAFLGCCSLVDINIPPSVTDIGVDAFFRCTSLKTIINYPNLMNNEIPLLNIDEYDINCFIIQRNFANVFKVINKKTGEEFALKAYIASDFKNVIQFKQRIDISWIDIPGLIKIQNFRFPLKEKEKRTVKTLHFTINNNKYDLTGYIMIQKFMKNGDIINITREYLQTQKSIDNKMNPTIRSKIIFGIASIMKHLHKRSVIHRYLRMECILLNDKFEPQIGSFFYATYFKDQELEMCIGSPLYMAPELFTDEDEKYSFPVDVYAYAIILYKMFSNDILFADRRVRTPQQLMMRVMRGTRLIRPKNIPDHYWDLIEMCWKHNPLERPTFDEITKMLKDDKYALEEFGLKTDLNELHEYQQRIDID